MTLLICIGSTFEGTEMRDLHLLQLGHGSEEPTIFDNRLFHVFELEQRGILYLVYLNGVVLDLPQLEQSILTKRMHTFTISLLILAR